ncbi:MAG: riboflavin biosynthesis protein RibF [Clostridia bacterium]|nr:riboflavin biosynthesis protein RibF [Clostridia bacterium]
MMNKKVFALGFFDGVHIGHAAILRKTVAVAAERGLTSAALTFRTHPRSFVLGISPRMLTTLERRTELIRQTGVAEVEALDFDAETAAMGPQEFIEMLRGRGCSYVVCGESFRFGRNASGSAADFAVCGMEAFVCPAVKSADGDTVSSTAIRRFADEGEMERAAAFLGRPFTLDGCVGSGFRIGHTIGFPTINLRCDPDLLIPRRGVYVSNVVLDGARFRAVTNVGTRPTFSTADIVSIESYILDFSGDLYGKKCSVEFMKYLRSEQTFGDAEALRRRIALDVKEAMEFEEAHYV